MLENHVNKATSAKSRVASSIPVAKSKKKGKQLGFLDEYAPALQSTKCVTIKKQYDHFIGGKFVKPDKNKYMTSINPATGEVHTHFAIGSKEDVEKAFTVAKKSYETVWSKLSGKERGRYLFRIARIIQERSREFAVLETMDGGKPIKESRDVDLPLAAQHFFYYGGWADKLDYAFPGHQVGSLGVCGQIIPWNFPLLMAAWKIAPALATGNTVVLKPAETTPLTALLLAEVLQEAELPEGVVNIVTGAAETGRSIVEHEGFAKIAFTGSTSVGKQIVKNLAHRPCSITMELGGKSANIIFADAAIDQAVEGIVNGIFFNQGHVCCAGSRLLIEESVEDQVVEKLKRRMNQLRVGNPLDKNTDIGAINSLEQLNRIEEMVKIGKSEGGDYYEIDAEIPAKGYFHKPCFLTNQTSAHTLSRSEVFGPVLSIMSFRTPAEAVLKANDTRFGLAAGIWSEKSSKVNEVAKHLKAGVVWCNTYNQFDAASPFGGYKESGWGREGGKHGLYPYLEVKR